ncbi:Ionotropic receptor 150 [Frankliniella occidentalis]|nr:Ionotropic receptor 150 [Frankliniella occidentalis]
MDVVLALALFCAGAPGALPALTVVDVSAVPEEAASAAALMSPFLRPQKAGVVVLGQVRWANAFMRGLPQETLRVLLTEPSYYEESDRLRVQVQVRHHVFVVVADGPEALISRTTGMTKSMCRFHRALFWTTAVATSAQEVVANKTFLGGITQWRDCNAQTVLALTAADGTTTLYALVPPDCSVAGEVVPPVTELNRCAPGEQRWLSGASPFSKFCDHWVPTENRDHFTLFVIGQWGGGNKLYDLLSQNIRRYNKFREKVLETVVNLDNRQLQVVLSKIKQCRLDGFLVLYQVEPPSSDDLTCFYDSMGTPVVVVVPAGLGPAVNPLDAVLVEFSPAVWLGTALAALSTAAALACTLRRDRGAALLLALAPLLGQAPDTPPPAGRALRPLLGVWLLVCIVLVAAYQGLLLGQLSTTRTHSEINNWRDLEDSGLHVHASWPVLNQLDGVLPENVRRRLIVHRFVSPMHFIPNQVVLGRNCALIVDMDEALARGVRSWLAPTKSLHIFTTGALFLRITGLWSPSSPLGKIIPVAFRRAHEVGLSHRHNALADFKERLTREKATEALVPARPLTLLQMYPAFLCLIGGHILGAVVLVMELLVSRLTVHEKP